jgi:hypothetical protein
MWGAGVLGVGVLGWVDVVGSDLERLRGELCQNFEGLP